MPVKVALRKESVDRNREIYGIAYSAVMSLSARRAWIEMAGVNSMLTLIQVALRKESVDRNNPPIKPTEIGPNRRSPQGERG